MRMRMLMLMLMRMITGVVREHDHPLPARDGGGELVEGEDGVREHERRGAHERGDARVVAVECVLSVDVC